MNYLEVLLESDSRLREKFGSLITDWKPSETNCFFLSEDEYNARFGFNDPNYREGPWHSAATHYATKTMYFRVTDELTKDELLTSAAHEMLHLHGGGEATPFLFDHKAEFEGFGDDEKFQVRYLTTEVIINLLAARALGKAGRLDTLAHNWSFTGLITRVGLLRMVDVLGDEYDQELFELLRGVKTEGLVTKFESVFGEGSFKELFLDLIDLQARSDFLWDEDQEEKVSEAISDGYMEFLSKTIEMGAQKAGKPELGSEAFQMGIVEMLALAYRKAKPEDQAMMREMLLGPGEHEVKV